MSTKMLDALSAHAAKLHRTAAILEGYAFHLDALGLMPALAEDMLAIADDLRAGDKALTSAYMDEINEGIDRARESSGMLLTAVLRGTIGAPQK